MNVERKGSIVTMRFSPQISKSTVLLNSLTSTGLLFCEAHTVEARRLHAAVRVLALCTVSSGWGPRGEIRNPGCNQHIQ